MSAIAAACRHAIRSGTPARSPGPGTATRGALSRRPADEQSAEGLQRVGVDQQRRVDRGHCRDRAERVAVPDACPERRRGRPARRNGGRDGLPEQGGRDRAGQGGGRDGGQAEPPRQAGRWGQVGDKPEEHRQGRREPEDRVGRQGRKDDGNGEQQRGPQRRAWDGPFPSARAAAMRGSFHLGRAPGASCGAGGARPRRSGSPTARAPGMTPPGSGSGTRSTGWASGSPGRRPGPR